MADDPHRMIARGIPGVSYVRVMTDGNSKSASNVEVDKNSVTVLSDTEPRARFDGNQIVLERGLSDEEVCEQIIGVDVGAGAGMALNPIHAFVADAATTLVILSGSKASRKWQFLKKTFLPFVANEVFSQIGDKEQNETDYSFHASLSAFEIQDEVVTDLLRPSTRGLTVSASAEEGVIIPGLLREMAKDEAGMRQLFVDACDNRATHALPIGASINTSCALWEINLSQSEGVNEGQSTRKCHSRLLVLDLPCTDSLVSANDTEPLESLSLHRSLITFIDVAHRLSTPTKAALAPFRTSKLTHYLSELLGGNALVVGLSHVVGNEAPQSRKTLDIAGALGDSVHFPVSGRELTDVLTGLLGKYRALILQLEDEIQNGAPIGEKPPDISEKVVTELQRDLAAAQLDRNVAREDRQRIFEMMELLKAKYQTIMEDKSKQSQELIRAEEDKLSVARALVELKLEHSAKQEQVEKEKFEITSALLAAKNEIFDLDQQLLLARTEGQSLKEASEDLEKRVQKDMDELVAVKAQLAEVREQLQRETDTRIELGAELLTLLNQKSLLQRKVDEQQQSLDRLSVQLSAVNAEEQEANAAKVAAMDSLREKDDLIAQQRREFMESEMESKSLRMELEHLKQDAERASSEWERERDATQMLLRETEAKLEDAKKNTGPVATPGAGAGGAGVDRSMVTRLEHKVRDMQREVKRARADEEEMRTSKLHAEEEMQKARKLYQEKISEKIMQSDSDTEERAINEVHETDARLTELMEYYKNKEDSMAEMVVESTKQVKVLKMALQDMFDKYQEALDQVEEHITKAKAPGKGKAQLDETMFIGEATIKSAADNVIAADSFEARIQRQRLELAEGTIAEEQEKMAIVLNAFKRRLKMTEEDLAKQRTKNADLSTQVQQLVAAGPKKRPPSAEDRERAVQNKANSDILKAMQEQFAKQIQMLKDGAAAPPAKTPSASTTNLEATPESAGADKILTAPPSRSSSKGPSRPQSGKAGLPTPPLTAFSSAPGTPLAGSRPTSANPTGMNLDTALKYIADLESEGSNAMQVRMRDVERRNAELSRRNAQLEAEMKSYQAYMKEMMLKRQNAAGGGSKASQKRIAAADGGLPAI